MALGKRREFEVFTLSFLDCICCGFGAIILLLVLTDIGQPIVIERSEKDLKQQILDLQRQLFELRGESEVLNRELLGRTKVLTTEQQKAAALAGDLSKIRGEFKASKGEASVTNVVETELVAAHQTLTAEMQRLLKNAPKKIDTTLAVGGIPVDSEWIIFVIDTSGSMQADNWENAQNVMKEILDIYPKVKGLQILDDEGKPMFSSTKGQWLQDTAAQRAKILATMANWKAYSNSSPVEGIGAAVQGWWAADKKISVYVIADDIYADLLVGRPPALHGRADAFHGAGVAVGLPVDHGRLDLGALRRGILQPLALGAREQRLALVVEHLDALQLG